MKCVISSWSILYQVAGVFLAKTSSFSLKLELRLLYCLSSSRRSIEKKKEKKKTNHVANHVIC